MDVETISTIINVILLIVITIGSVYWRKARRKLRLIIEFLEELDMSLKDEKISAKELKVLIKKAREFIEDC